MAGLGLGWGWVGVWLVVWVDGWVVVVSGFGLEVRLGVWFGLVGGSVLALVRLSLKPGCRPRQASEPGARRAFTRVVILIRELISYFKSILHDPPHKGIRLVEPLCYEEGSPFLLTRSDTHP